MTPEMIRAERASGKLVKTIAHETGLSESQVKRISARAGVTLPKRANTWLSLDIALLDQIRRRAARNGRPVARELEHLLRLALSEEEKPRADDC